VTHSYVIQSSTYGVLSELPPARITYSAEEDGALVVRFVRNRLIDLCVIVAGLQCSEWFA